MAQYATEDSIFNNRSTSSLESRLNEASRASPRVRLERRMESENKRRRGREAGRGVEVSYALPVSLGLPPLLLLRLSIKAFARYECSSTGRKRPTAHAYTHTAPWPIAPANVCATSLSLVRYHSASGYHRNHHQSYSLSNQPPRAHAPTYM